MENSTRKSAIPRPTGIPRFSRLPVRSAVNPPAEPNLHTSISSSTAPPSQRKNPISQYNVPNRSTRTRPPDGVSVRASAAPTPLAENDGYNALPRTYPADKMESTDPFIKRRTEPENLAAEVRDAVETRREPEIDKTEAHRRPRPSLADRTIETLSQIPPSPSPRRRQSGFFPQEASSGSLSRPGSSLNRSRPNTSIGYHPPLSTRPQTGYQAPDLTPSKRSISSYAPRSVPHSQMRPKNPSDTTPSKIRLSSPSKARTRPTNTLGQSSTRMSSPAPMASKPSSLRSPPHISTPTRAPKPRPTEQHTPKSSAALRETIAKAKAAAAAKSKTKATLDTGFEIQVDTDATSLRKRITMALEDGKLNIPALGLTEIPKEVLNMYDYGPLESVDITKINAADNELRIISDEVFPDIDTEARLREDEDFLGLLFGALGSLDLHGNQLMALPRGLRRLDDLTTLNLSKNRLTNATLDIITEIPSLRELRLAENALEGSLPTFLCNLQKLELLDLHDNAISEIPDSIEGMRNLSVLNVSGNKLSCLPWHALSSLALNSLDASKNRLSGALFPSDDIPALVSLSLLDVAFNGLTSLTHTMTLPNLPNIQTLTLTHNRLKHLPDISALTSLTTLSTGNNQLTSMPEGMTVLQGLRTVDLSTNSIRAIDPGIGKMESLRAIMLEGNPLRMGERRLLGLSTDDLKAELKGRGGGAQKDED